MTPISMLSKSMKTAMFSRVSVKVSFKRLAWSTGRVGIRPNGAPGPSGADASRLSYGRCGRRLPAVLVPEPDSLRARAGLKRHATWRRIMSTCRRLTSRAYWHAVSQRRNCRPLMRRAAAELRSGVVGTTRVNWPRCSSSRPLPPRPVTSYFAGADRLLGAARRLDRQQIAIAASRRRTRARGRRRPRA